MKKKEALVIVAHPDDETIWMGGTILKNKNWNWTIICLCRGRDKDRRPKFEKVCKILNAKCTIDRVEDTKLKPFPIKKIEKIIEKNTEGKYDYVFTHGKNGEYGHIRHKECHRAVKKLVKQGKIKCKQLLFFSYKKKGDIPEPNKQADILYKLNKQILLKKKRIVNKVYGFQKNSFEVLSCKQEESFDKK